jgi:2-keto-4-pentenoate hydratase/2-oxohepta-3-ene-1,7-dioic acid hydratase in catechol pathway
VLLSINVIRTAKRWYVQRGSEAFPVDAELPTTAELVAAGVDAVRAAAPATAGGVPADRLSLRSPVTTPCRVVAQAVNYRGHAQESGFGESPPAVFFRKSSASISGPTDDVVRPGHVRLLDYELEVGLVMGHQLPIGAAVTDADLPDYVAAVVMCNDVSARDVQLEKGQFYESKSYPTFTPTGPRLVLLEAEDFARLAGLRLRLWVNGELRQDGTVADMITRPAAALTQLAQVPAAGSGRSPLDRHARRDRAAGAAGGHREAGGPAADAAQVAGVLLPPGTQSRLPQGRRRGHRVGRHRGRDAGPRDPARRHPGRPMTAESAETPG